MLGTVHCRDISYFQESTCSWFRSITDTGGSPGSLQVDEKSLVYRQAVDIPSFRSFAKAAASSEKLPSQQTFVPQMTDPEFTSILESSKDKCYGSSSSCFSKTSLLRCFSAIKPNLSIPPSSILHKCSHWSEERRSPRSCACGGGRRQKTTRYTKSTQDETKNNLVVDESLGALYHHQSWLHLKRNVTPCYRNGVERSRRSYRDYQLRIVHHYSIHFYYRKRLSINGPHIGAMIYKASPIPLTVKAFLLTSTPILSPKATCYCT